ncbi:hypothetical protein 1 [Beihai picorna-like virus 54]|uniref:hypothetical protein 1 n=1 Tax=Beihai picorna-like virus 54 TaxID=1922599 RepID=UPI00090B384E|nr:hypothetical protein 1 [Beihai picorna-like virus 54]APG76863.1 hypothetical protein 1 [Beihai picorna-like virus 54]
MHDKMSTEDSYVEDPDQMVGVEMTECDPKSYTKSIYEFRSEKRRVHRKKTKAVQLKAHRRYNKKKSKKGLKPEGGEEPLDSSASQAVSDVTYTAEDSTVSSSQYRLPLEFVFDYAKPMLVSKPWSYTPSAAEKEWFSNLKDSLNVVDQDDKARLMKMVMMTMNYFASLLLCENWKQVASCTSQFVIPLIPTEMISFIIGKLSIQPEGGDDQDRFSTFIASLREARLTMVGLASVPFIKQISRVVALISLSGLTPEFVKNRAFLSEGLDQWSAKIASTNMWDNFLELIVGSIEFVGEFLLAWKSRSFDKLLMPSDVHNRCVRVLAFKDSINRGEVEKVHGKTNAQVREEATDCIKEVERLIKTKGTPIQERFALSRYVKDLLELQNQIDFMDKGNKLHEEPLCIIIYGEPSVGKSGIMFTLIKILSERYGFDAEDENIWYPAKGDEYDTGYNGKITVIIDDDRANETKDFIGKTKYARLLQWVNIVPAVTVQADLEKKSRIPYDFKLVIGSTNNLRMNVEHFAINQLAHLRRCIEIEARVKPEYKKEIRTSNGKTLTTNAIDASKWTGPADDPFHEMHEIRMVYWTQKPEQSNAVCHYGKWMNAPDAYHEIVAECDRRKASCRKYLDSITTIRQSKTCSGCGFPKKWCRHEKDECHDCEPEYGETLVAALNSTNLYNTVLLHMLWRFAPGFFLHGSLCDWISIQIMRALCYGIRFIGSNWVVRLLIGNLIFAMAGMLFGCGNYRLFAWMHFMMLVLAWLILAPRIKHMIERQVADGVMNTVSGMPTLLIAGQVMALGTSAYMLYSALKTLASLTRTMSIRPEGRLQPANQTEVRERNAETNPWLTIEPPQYVRPTKARNMTADQVINKLRNNLLHVNMMSVRGNSKIFSNMFIIQPGVGLLPHHALQEMDWKVHKLHMVRGSDTPACKMSCFIHNAVRIGTSDFVLVQLTGLCSFTDALDFLPEQHWPHRGLTTMVTREQEGHLSYRRVNHVFNNYVSNGLIKWAGSYHHFPPGQPTSRGDCCSFLVSDLNPHLVVGFHMGGAPGRGYGCSHQLTKQMVLDALDTFPKKIEPDQPIPLPMAESGEIVVDRFGRHENNYTPDFHPRAVVNFGSVVNGHVAEYYPVGTIKTNRSKYISEVRKTPMSPYLEEQGRPCKWGPPLFRSDRNHADHFQIMIHGEHDYPPAAVDWAVRDYLTEMHDCLKRCPPDVNRPLTLDQAINGMPGQRFIGRMNMKTSSGFGLKGKKIKHFENLGTELDPHYVPSEELEREIHLIVEKYKNGQMDHPIARSGLKDEPTKIGKEWVRVFSTLPVASLIVAKMWIMPVINFINSHPLSAETAVGVNCTNDEWHEAGEWLDEFPLAVEGDYSKYDIRQNGQIMRAFVTVIVDLARHMGYAEDDLKILQTVMFDHTATTWMYAGTLFKTDGSLPSGALDTILLNGGGNSLRKRVFYYITWWHKLKCQPEPFRKHVHALTMGDDSGDTTDLLWYNAREMQLFFSHYNMPFTDSNKSEIAVPNVHFSELSFCKRRWRMDARTRKFMAPIEIDSIYKSLHCVRKSDTPIGDIMIGNVDNALRELARHDRDVFEEERAIIHKALEKMHMTHLSRHIYTTYEEWGRIFFAGSSEGNQFDLFFDAFIEDEGSCTSSL